MPPPGNPRGACPTLGVGVGGGVLDHHDPRDIVSKPLDLQNDLRVSKTGSESQNLTLDNFYFLIDFVA